MGLPTVLDSFSKRPGMYIYPVDYSSVSTFVQGLDAASYGGFLTGFHEWLIVKGGYGNNLVWQMLVLRLAFPDSDSPREELKDDKNQRHAIKMLFGLLESFWEERTASNGLRRIFLRYEEWLRKQPWYSPSSPDWIQVKMRKQRLL